MPVKPKTVRAIHANRGVEAKYRSQLERMVAEMYASFDYWIKAAYRKYPPRMVKLVNMAEDASPPSKKMKAVLEELAARWIEKFDEAAPRIADAYVKSMYRATDSAFKSALRDAGWTVEFQMTPAMRDALNASINENISLIKSIPEKYQQQVEGIVMRSYANGRDLSTMTKDLQKLYPELSNRVKLIARDQSNKASAVIMRTRQLDLGITEAIWMHSNAGKVPRPDHLAANGKKYKIAEGCLISGEYVQPGEEINCRCTSRSVLPI